MQNVSPYKILIYFKIMSLLDKLKTFSLYISIYFESINLFVIGLIFYRLNIIFLIR